VVRKGLSSIYHLVVVVYIFIHLNTIRMVFLSHCTCCEGVSVSFSLGVSSFICIFCFPRYTFPHYTFLVIRFLVIRFSLYVSRYTFFIIRFLVIRSSLYVLRHMFLHHMFLHYMFFHYMFFHLFSILVMRGPWCHH